MIELLEPPLSCKYVASHPKGWEYGFEVKNEKGATVRNKLGVAKTFDDAMQHNGMSPVDMESLCSGKQSVRSSESHSPRRGRPPRLVPQSLLE